MPTQQTAGQGLVLLPSLQEEAGHLLTPGIEVLVGMFFKHFFASFWKLCENCFIIFPTVELSSCVYQVSTGTLYHKTLNVEVIQAVF